MADIQDSENTTANSILSSLSGAEYALFIQTGDLVDAGSSYTQRLAAYEQLEQLGDVDRIYAIGNHERRETTPLPSPIRSARLATEVTTPSLLAICI